MATNISKEACEISLERTAAICSRSDCQRQHHLNKSSIHHEVIISHPYCNICRAMCTSVCGWGVRVAANGVCKLFVYLWNRSEQQLQNISLVVNLSVQVIHESQQFTPHTPFQQKWQRADTTHLSVYAYVPTYKEIHFLFCSGSCYHYTIVPVITIELIVLHVKIACMVTGEWRWQDDPTICVLFDPHHSTAHSLIPPQTSSTSTTVDSLRMHCSPCRPKQGCGFSDVI